MAKLDIRRAEKFFKNTMGMADDDAMSVINKLQEAGATSQKTLDDVVSHMKATHRHEISAYGEDLSPFMELDFNERPLHSTVWDHGAIQKGIQPIIKDTNELKDIVRPFTKSAQEREQLGKEAHTQAIQEEMDQELALYGQSGQPIMYRNRTQEETDQINKQLAQEKANREYERVAQQQQEDHLREEAIKEQAGKEYADSMLSGEAEQRRERVMSNPFLQRATENAKKGMLTEEEARERQIFKAEKQALEDQTGFKFFGHQFRRKTVDDEAVRASIDQKRRVREGFDATQNASFEAIKSQYQGEENLASNYMMSRAQKNYELAVSKIKNGQFTGTAKEAMQEAQDAAMKRIEGGPGVMDYLHGYHVPETATGLGIMFSATSAMFGNGARSNAELYSSPF